ncbi:ECF RNA polymerase sigma factor SigW [Clostridia bacterium]|nr:ECF RNA polymerase sigma factor SigW [Clostridia bacterium]
MDNTSEIIEKMSSGDDSAFEDLVREYEKKIYNLCLRMTGNPDDAFDLSQETFVKAYRALSAFKMESAVSTWLYRIASNTCLDFIRKRNRVIFFTLSQSRDDEEEIFAEIPDNSYNPEKVFESAQIREAVAAALLGLPPKHRQIVVLREINGLSYAEISEILEISEGTVKSRLARAREHLRRELGNV